MATVRMLSSAAGHDADGDLAAIGNQQAVDADHVLDQGSTVFTIDASRAS
jgi:hypothetical protein